MLIPPSNAGLALWLSLTRLMPSDDTRNTSFHFRTCAHSPVAMLADGTALACSSLKMRLVLSQPVARAQRPVAVFAPRRPAGACRQQWQAKILTS